MPEWIKDFASALDDNILAMTSQCNQLLGKSRDQLRAEILESDKMALIEKESDLTAEKQFKMKSKIQTYDIHDHPEYFAILKERATMMSDLASRERFERIENREAKKQLSYFMRPTLKKEVSIDMGS
mmetsp:Transcript_29381/g.44381  ORF Transcript_29381/g.44381 Transcript_29381/m.44381 type:complete len:127 (+) Transcript_29381:3367-3747(+)